MNQALNDLANAIEYASAESPRTFTSAAAGTLDGMSLNPGIYQWGGALTLSTSVTLIGNCGDIFVFQVGAAFSTAASSRVILSGGVTAATVYWQITAAFGTGASSTFYGIVLAGQTFTLGASAVFVGTAYSQTSVTLGANAVASLPLACKNENSGNCYSFCDTACPAGAQGSR